MRCREINVNSGRPKRPRHRPRGILLLLVLIALWSALPTAAAAGAYEPRISQLIVSNNQRNITMFAQLTGSFDAEVLASLHHGLPFTLEFKIEVYRERQLWPDQLITTVLLTHEVKYDIIKEMYQFNARYGGQEINKSTVKLEEAQRWMNSIDGVDIVSLELVKGDRRYFLQVRVTVATAQDFFSKNIFFFQQSGQYQTPWFRSSLFGISSRQGP